jgi:hypothetical protein
MRSSSEGAIKAFATLRIAGDNLLPDEITEILRTYPTLAYRKGEKYNAGKSSGEMVGRTGVWYLDTDKIVSSENLLDHLIYLVGILMPEITLGSSHVIIVISHKNSLGKSLRKLGRLQQTLQKRNAKATISLFWHGEVGARHPSIPRFISSILRLVPIDIETDFDTDEITTRDVA